MTAPMSSRVSLWSRIARGLAVFWVGLVLSLLAWYPALEAYPKTQGYDGQFYYKMLEAARSSVLLHHELPLWNPYECGGVPLWDNPQSFIASPLAWLALPLGTPRAILLWYVLHSAFGFYAMWELARRELRLSREAAFAAAGFWAFCGFHLQHYSGGHVTFVGFLCFPLAIVLWRRAEQSASAAVGLGVLAAWMFWEGNVYPLPHLVVVLAVETLTRCWRKGKQLPILRAVGIVGLIGFSLAAARLIPVLYQLKSHTRPIGIETDSMQWQTLIDMFLSRTHARSLPGQQYVWPEYGSYIGPFGLLLAAIGIVVCGVERAWILAILVAVFALMLGHFHQFAPWHLLKSFVPPFKQMRVPSRFRAEVLMCFSVLVGIAIDRFPDRIGKLFGRYDWVGPLRISLVALALVGVGDTIATGVPVTVDSFRSPAALADVKPSPRLFLGGADIVQLMDQPRQNRGRAECWDEWGFGAGAPLWEGDVLQAKVLSGTAVIKVAERSQNKFHLVVEASTAAKIQVNGTFDLGWRTNTGTLSNNDRALALELPPGHHDVQLRYWPLGLSAGLIINVLGLLGLTGFCLSRGFGLSEIRGWISRRRS